MSAGKKFEDLIVTAVRDEKLGEFYYDQRYNTMDWRTPEGDEVSLFPEEWARLGERLWEIMNELGVWGK